MTNRIQFGEQDVRELYKLRHRGENPGALFLEKLIADRRIVSSILTRIASGIDPANRVKRSGVLGLRKVVLNYKSGSRANLYNGISQLSEKFAPRKHKIVPLRPFNLI